MKLGVLLDLRCRNFGFFLLNKDMGPLGFENGWSQVARRRRVGCLSESPHEILAI